MIKIAICDDNEIFAENLRKEVEECIHKEPGLNAGVDSFINGSELMEAFEKEQYDLIYLDIELKEQKGIDLANSIHNQKPECLIIFVTGYANYVCQSFIENAFQYIQKPIEPKFFASEFKRAIETIRVNKTSAIITTNKGACVFKLCDVYYIQTSYKDFIVHTTEGEVKGPIKAIRKVRQKLLDYDFYRIQRSYLINMNHIVRLNNNIVTMTDGSELTVSKKKLADFKRVLLSKKIG